MADLQELIARGRFLLSESPKRLQVFTQINGKNSTKDIKNKFGRSLSSVNNDCEKLRSFELIQEKKDSQGKPIKKEHSTVFEKVPLIKHVPLLYFQPVANTTPLVKKSTSKKGISKKMSPMHIPTENEILEICKNGEDQLYEFKQPGVTTEKISREIAALLNTKNGGIVMYGISDDGIVIGSNISRQKMDERIQNSVYNTISPSPKIIVKDKDVMGSKVILIIVQPWDRQNLYQYTKDRMYLIRKGTNVFALKPDEMKKLAKGEYVI